MKNVFTLLFFALTLCTSLIAQEQRTVFGIISDGKEAMENVNVNIVDKEKSTLSNKNGRYELTVATGDVIEFSYSGMKTIFIRVEDVTRILNPVMIPNITELDEVVVKASKRRSQKDMEEDYDINNSIIKTAWGYLDADRAAGRVQMITEDEINAVSGCILNLIGTRFASVRTSGGCAGSGGAVVIRGVNSIRNTRGAIFDVDGQIFTDVPWWVDISNVKRVALLGGLSTTVKYGNLGNGGVVVINTISGNPINEKFVDRARLRNNYSDGKELSKLNVAKNASNYEKEFIASSSFKASKAIFEKYKKAYSSSPYFLLDSYVHFVDIHDELEFADNIIANYFPPYTNNPVLLKALAYSYESQKRFEKANAVYKEIFILRPNYAQSYMDMANSYRNIKQPKQAASIYARYDYLIEKAFLEQDTIVFGPIIDREYNNLLALEKENLMEGRKSQKLFVAEEDFKGTRLVFEWNDSEAEFDLQFVNPENQYYKWNHSLADNSESIYREKDHGYGVSEYLIDDYLAGTWQVNVNYLGNKSLSPTYLKATVYYDYGSRNQRKEVKVFKLSLKNVNQELFRLQSSSKLAAR